MLQVYSTVYDYINRKSNCQAYNTKTYHEGKPLHLGSFLLKLNFSHVHFSGKLLQIGPYKSFDRLSDVTYELFSQNCSTFHSQKTTLYLFIQKNHFYTLIFETLCVFQTSSNMTYQNPFSMQIMTHLRSTHYHYLINHQILSFR